MGQAEIHGGNRMKKLLIASIAVTAFCSASALAADMPVKAPVYKAAPAPVFNWTGFYGGLQAGYGWGNSVFCDVDGPGGDACLPRYNIDGFVGGGTLGYNWQAIGNPWVFGIETDLSYAHVKGGHPTLGGFGCAGLCETDVKWFGTVRGRIGPAFGQFFPYLTGGFAFAKLHGQLGSVGGADGTKSAGTFGGGVEYAFAPNWSAKIEYLYVDKFGRFNVFQPCSGICIVTDTRMNVVRAGLNYRFGTR